MPTFEEKSNPYEILIRFDEQTGALKGAHQQRIDIVLKDGEVINATIGDAVPVDLANFAASDLMTETLQAALQANSALQAQLALVTGLNDTLNAGLSEANAQIASLTAALAAAIQD